MLSSFIALISAPVVNMREFPSESAEIVSQAYFSEEVSVIEENEGWIKIETAVDHYQGWIIAGEICEKKEKFPATSSRRIAKVNRCMAHLYHVPDTVYGPILTLPFESLLDVIDQDDEPNSRWIRVTLANQSEGFIQRGDVTFNLDYLSQDQLPTFSLHFQGLPYTWGGRSSFGYDCSGFVQMLYRQMGVYIPRDSKDQAKWEGFKAVSIGDLSPGDLIFFGLNENTIRHVGMYMGADQFIHSTVAENAPYIHISCLSDPEWSGSGKWRYRIARTLNT
jgi:gamma-D-glutamyl-L-lysine dipeptidyl-peptidase